MNRSATLILSFAPLALAACMDQQPREMPPVAPAAQAVGPAQNCLQRSYFSETRVRDDRTIDFISGAGGRAWRVTLPNRCIGLRAANTFTYETSLSQLCSTDIIYPLHQTGGSYQRGPGCGLGPFVPVKLAR